MKRELKEKWMAALRSGEYQQGRNALRVPIYACDDEGNATDDVGGYEYCCLGVLHEIAGLDERHESGGEKLSSKGLDAVGLSRDEQNFLMGANDGTGNTGAPWSFPTISNWIGDNIKAED